MNRAFTMIELIFVIVMIGILASIAIPKLAATRDDADSAMCALEVAQLTREISNNYTVEGHKNFIGKYVSGMTNIKILANSPGETSGIPTDENIVTGIKYRCDGVDIANYIYSYDATTLRYGLTLNITDGTTPASLLASSRLKKNLGITGSNGKYYVF